MDIDYLDDFVISMTCEDYYNDLIIPDGDDWCHDADGWNE